MFVSQLRFRNFKGIREGLLELSDFTVLIQPCCSDKTTVSNKNNRMAVKPSGTRNTSNSYNTKHRDSQTIQDTSIISISLNNGLLQSNNIEPG